MWLTKGERPAMPSWNQETSQRKNTFISDLSSSSSTVQIARLLHIWKNTLLCLWLTFCGVLHLMVYIIGGNPLPQLCASVCIWSADGHDVLLCSVFGLTGVWMLWLGLMGAFSQDWVKADALRSGIQYFVLLTGREITLCCIFQSLST